MNLLHGDCRALLAGLPAASVDAIVTDPPYELGFMGKSWDRSGVAFQPATWAAALRVLKPGGHLVAFGGTRTFHRLACAIEDAGFELRDTLMWVHGQGFPKSLDVGKALDKAAGAARAEAGPHPWAHVRGNGSAVQTGVYDGGATNRRGSMTLTAPATDLARQWDGWGTALKPGWEPILLARAPLSEPTVAANVSRWGTGALNIGATRIGTSASDAIAMQRANTPGAGRFKQAQGTIYGGGEGLPMAGVAYNPAAGRWPANVVLSHTPQCRLVRADGFQDCSHDGDHIACVGDAGQMHSDGAASSIDGSVTLNVAVAPMLSGVQFNGQPNIGQPEVNDKGPAGVGDNMLVLHDDTEGAQRIRNGPLNIGDRQGAPSGVACGAVSRHSGDVPNTADIQTGHGAEYAPIRTTDTGDRRLEAAPAHRAQTCLPGFGSATTIDIRTGPRTRRALPHAELSVGDAVGGATNGAIVGVTGHQSPPSDYTTPQPETVEAWECAPDCPILLLDQQSGERAGATSNSHRARTNGYDGAWCNQAKVAGYGDTGGASRFFANFPADEIPTRFLYQAKASTSERSAGLPAGERNSHPTVKSVALCRWLIRLICPPGGVVCDPFMGSGSIGVAAREEGARYIGMEQHAPYLATAAQRIGCEVSA